MLAGSLCAACLPLEMAGLFAIWNWSRRSAGTIWLAMGGAVLVLMTGSLCLFPGMATPRSCLALAGMYLFSGLMWAWWVEGLRPADWAFGEGAVALLAAGMFSLASR